MIEVLSRLVGRPFSYFQVPLEVMRQCGILALVSGLSIVLGFKARWGAIGIIAFLIPVTFMMHNFWAVTDPMQHQVQMVMFWKNLELVGAAMMFVVFGAGGLSLDARMAGKAAGGAELNPA